MICYDNVIFNFYYFITVPIGKTCSMSLMRFNNRTFYILFYFIDFISFISTLIPSIDTFFPQIFRISTQIPRIATLILRTRILIPFLAFPPLFFGIPLFCSPTPHFGFYRYSTQFIFFKHLFQENSCLSSKSNTPLFYYCITLRTKLLFTSSMTSSVLSPKVIYLMVPQVKNL